MEQEMLKLSGSDFAILWKQQKFALIHLDEEKQTLANILQSIMLFMQQPFISKVKSLLVDLRGVSIDLQLSDVYQIVKMVADHSNINQSMKITYLADKALEQSISKLYLSPLPVLKAVFNTPEAALKSMNIPSMHEELSLILAEEHVH